MSLFFHINHYIIKTFNILNSLRETVKEKVASEFLDSDFLDMFYKFKNYVESKKKGILEKKKKKEI